MAQQDNNQQPNKLNNNRGKRPKGARVMYIVYGIIMIGIAYLFFGGGGSGSSQQPITWDRLEPILERQDYESITVVNQEVAEIRIKHDVVKRDTATYRDIISRTISGGTGPQGYYTYNVGTLDHFDRELAIVEQKTGRHISYKIETNNSIWRELLVWFGPLLMLIFFFWIMSSAARRQMGGDGNGGGFGGIFGFGRSNAKQYDATKQNNVSFKDVAGLAGAKEEVMEVVDFLKNPKRYTDLGGKIPKGVLLVGPPGTGKTLLAKAVAGEAGVPFFSMSGSDFVEMFVGVGASRVRGLFEEAKKKAPCIVFIDEIDAVGRARGKNGITGGNDERESTLNQLLTEMDGFSSTTNVIVMAATNRADVLDKALLRAGRFDRQIYVELPDLEERKAIFAVHMKGLKLVKDKNSEAYVDRAFLAKQTPGFSGADIANVCNEAALCAARKNKKEIEKQDFLDAVDRIVGGLEKRTKVLTDQEKHTIAYHESGHASVSWLLRWANPLVKVTIVPRGKALGAAWYLPEERQITTYEQMFDEMTSLMAGRASEEIVYGKISTGALNDIERATKMAQALVTYYGMSPEVGNISFYDSTGQSEWGLTKPFSEKTAETIDREVKRMVEEAYGKAKELLLSHREQLDQLAAQLYDKEVLFREDLERIYGPRPWETPETEKTADGDADESETDRDEENKNDFEEV
jgi:cell division protease FtsH